MQVWIDMSFDPFKGPNGEWVKASAYNVNWKWLGDLKHALIYKSSLICWLQRRMVKGLSLLKTRGQIEARAPRVELKALLVATVITLHPLKRT